MKFLKCPKCNDMIALRPWIKQCHCGKVSGRYLDDDKTTEIVGECAVLSVNNSDFFTIPEPNKYIKRQAVVWQ